MPNAVTENGLETQTRDELVTQFTAAFELIYGTDINLASNSPDGQMMQIFIQAVIDILDLITQVYNGFNPDLAIGAVLDQRVAYNGIQRQAGTYTITNITLVTTASLSNPLVGIDDDDVNPYTVADNEGNRWFLLETATGLSAGSHVLAFRAEFPGAVLTTIGTINVPVTVVLGVASINNPTTYTTLGINEETDAELRIRRQRSVSLSSQGYPAAMKAALENVPGVTSAQVYENNTGETDVNDVPGHTMWAVVAGAGTDAAIAQAIYAKRNMGCGMKGDQTYEIDPGNGNAPFVAKWDEVEPEDLYIRLFAVSLDGLNLPNVAAILSVTTGLAVSFAPAVAAEVNINGLGTAVQAIDSNSLVLSPGFSSVAGGPYTDTLSPTEKNKQFAVANARILILYALVNSIANGDTLQFAASGGTGPYAFSVVSGLGSISSPAGLFTSAGAGTTVIRVTDANGIKADATITVV
jgi:uncharacterized phage protein gp47/JayE